MPNTRTQTTFIAHLGRAMLTSLAITACLKTTDLGALSCAPYLLPQIPNAATYNDDYRTHDIIPTLRGVFWWTHKNCFHTQTPPDFSLLIFYRRTIEKHTQKPLHYLQSNKYCRLIFNRFAQFPALLFFLIISSSSFSCNFANTHTKRTTIKYSCSTNFGVNFRRWLSSSLSLWSTCVRESEQKNVHT